MCHAQLKATTLNVKSQHNLAAKSCPAHNFHIKVEFYNFLTNYFSVSNIYSGSITWFDRLLIILTQNIHIPLKKI